MKEIFTMKTKGESAIIIPRSKTWKLNPDAECNFRYKEQQSACNDSIHHGSKCGNFNPKCDMEEKKIVRVLCSLLKGNTASESEDHLCELKGYFQNQNRITVSDMQKICSKFGISVPLHLLEKLIEESGITFKDGIRSCDASAFDANWEDKINEKHNFKNLKNQCNSCQIMNSNQDMIDHFKSSASAIGDHIASVYRKTAGLPTVRNDIKRPKFRNTTDLKDYGDTKNCTTTIQPSVFEKHDISDEDLGALKSK
ncbi:EF-hand domain-containing family member B, partial [Stegodyphus mimosarum]